MAAKRAARSIARAISSMWNGISPNQTTCGRSPPPQPGQRGARGLEAGEGEMRRVRRGADEVAPARVVEGEHRLWIARERLWRGQAHGVEARPDSLALFVAKRAKAALAGDAGAGQDEDAFRHGRESMESRSLPRNAAPGHSPQPPSRAKS